MNDLNFSYDFRERLVSLVDRDKMYKGDLERKTLFYILAGNLDLYQKIDYIYDFENHMITPKCLESTEVDFCDSSRKLIKLAFYLFNGLPADVLDSFHLLDRNNFELALNAIKVRFGQVQYELSMMLNEMEEYQKSKKKENRDKKIEEKQNFSSSSDDESISLMEFTL